MFLLAIINKSTLYMVAPKSKLGYSHITKKDGTLTGVINNDRSLFDLHVNGSLSLAGKENKFFAIKEMVGLMNSGVCDMLIGTNELIFHVDQDKSIFVAPDYKIIGDEADTIRGAIFALSNLDISTEDKISIAMKAIDCYDYEIVRA